MTNKKRTAVHRKANATSTATPEKSKGVRQVQRDKTKLALLQSAAKVFADVGFEAAQTRTIASKAGVNHGLVHYHFSSKFRLWKACIDYLYALGDAEFRELSGGRVFEESDVDGNELAVMRSVIRSYVLYAARHPELARIVGDVSRSRGPRLDYLIQHHGRQRVEWLQDLIRRLQVKGHIPKVSPLLLQYMLWGMSHTIFTMAAEVKRKVGVDPTKDEDLITEQIRTIEILFFGETAAKHTKNDVSFPLVMSL